MTPAPRKYALIAGALLVLLAVYVFQRFDYLGAVTELFRLPQPHPYAVFAFNRAVRLVLNDGACLVLISVWFPERKYVRLATALFLLELFVILPLYLWIKLSLEGDSEISAPWLSQVHRIIVNPMLMLLLMVAFLYQRRVEKRVP